MRLYNGETYAALGYFDVWRKAVDNLRGRWELDGYMSDDFRRFFDKIKRGGVFMHSFNHPRVNVVTDWRSLWP